MNKELSWAVAVVKFKRRLTKISVKKWLYYKNIM